MKTISVIIAAFSCPEYIIECYDSVKQQVLFPLDDWEVDLRIGVDGCNKTAEKLKKNKIPFYWSPKNVGAYVMRNSLIYLSRADVYSYFDADDMMVSSYLKKILLKIERGAQAVITAKLQCNKNMICLGKPPIIEDGGAFSFTHQVLKNLGGYYHYRCAGDTDFMRRVQMADYNIVELKEPLYMRRRHPGSLTKSSVTKYHSAYRKKAWTEMCEKREAGIIKIKPTIINLEKIK